MNNDKTNTPSTEELFADLRATISETSDTQPLPHSAPAEDWRTAEEPTQATPVHPVSDQPDFTDTHELPDFSQPAPTQAAPPEGPTPPAPAFAAGWQQWQPAPPPQATNRVSVGLLIWAGILIMTGLLIAFTLVLPGWGFGATLTILLAVFGVLFLIGAIVSATRKKSS